MASRRNDSELPSRCVRSTRAASVERTSGESRIFVQILGYLHYSKTISDGVRQYSYTKKSCVAQ